MYSDWILIGAVYALGNVIVPLEQDPAVVWVTDCDCPLVTPFGGISLAAETKDILI